MDPTQLTPQQQQALEDYGFIQPARSKLVQQQLARAQALRGQKAQIPQYGLGGGLMAGAAQGINGLTAGLAENRAMKQQMDIAKQQAQDVNNYRNPGQAPASSLDAAGNPQGAEGSLAGMAPAAGLSSDEAALLSPEYGGGTEQPSLGMGAGDALRLQAPPALPNQAGNLGQVPGNPGMLGVPQALPFAMG
jgi:hypothetical protein